MENEDFSHFDLFVCQNGVIGWLIDSFRKLING